MRNLNILVVDDHPDNRGAMVMMLQIALPGVSVDSARDGEEALEKVRAGSFDFIITDAEMPRKDGIELIKQIRAAGIPVKILLNSGCPDYEAPAFAAGADGFILKPASLTQIKDAINRLFPAAPAPGPDMG